MNTPDQYGVVGHPISHSWSPFIHGLFAKQTDQSLVYRLYDIAPGNFRAQVLEFFTRGGRGLNVTVPHKEAAAELANELTARADRAGAVNTLILNPDHTLLGDNTDGHGLVTDLQKNLGLDIVNERLLILGAGRRDPRRDRTAAVDGTHRDRDRQPHSRPRHQPGLAVRRPGRRCAAVASRTWATSPFDIVINATAAGLAAPYPTWPAA
jgi:shikimate dehydrogenase